MAHIWKHISFCIAVFLYEIMAGTTKVSCPSVAAISPCTCEQGKLTCQALQRMSDLFDVVRGVNGFSLSRFTLEGSTLPALPTNLFFNRNIQIAMLRMKNTDLHFLVSPLSSSSPFEGKVEQSLVDIELDNVRWLHNWDWTKFHGMRNLENIEISNSMFLHIAFTFSFTSRVESLRIEYSQVHWIDDFAFSNFTELAFFSLKGNKLREFRRSFLPFPAVKLEEMNLSENLLTHIEEETFANTTSLTVLNLAQNLFTTLSEQILPSSRVDLSIRLQGNALFCNCSISWLLSKSSLLQIDLNSVTCSGPPSLAGQDLGSVTLTCQESAEV